jgi:hypothetical protein
MTRWRYLVLSVAILAFLLAATGSPDLAPNVPVLGGLLLRTGGMPFFWLGVLCCLAAVGWRGG